MAFSDFTFPKLKTLFGISYQYHSFVSFIQLSTPASVRLMEDIEDAKNFPLLSEKAKSEFLITPIIREIQRKNPHITIFSGLALPNEQEKLLNGTPDFMISAKPNLAGVEAPIFCMLEAKNGVLEEGFAQCAAEMYAARLFNIENGDAYETIYGAVTNAYDWIFLKLEANTVFIDKERYFLNDLPRILGIMQWIVNQYKP